MEGRKRRGEEREIRSDNESMTPERGDTNTRGERGRGGEGPLFTICEITLLSPPIVILLTPKINRANATEGPEEGMFLGFRNFECWFFEA
jgi:hypothetical protein